MNFEYPKMLYRWPAAGVGTHRLQDGDYDTAVIESGDDEPRMEADGWRATPPAAREAHAAMKAAAAQMAAAAQAAEAAPPTRDELEQKARELGISFDGRTSDKKLRDLITATLES